MNNIKEPTQLIADHINLYLIQYGWIIIFAASYIITELT